MALDDASARAVLLEAFERQNLRPNAAALQAVQAIGRFEGNYGIAFGGANNWGAIQCGAAPPCPPDCVELTDTHADGSKYQWCYRIYPTRVDGAADLIRELYRRPGVPEALASGDALAVATAMRESHYFEATAANYALAIERNAETIATNLEEPWIVKRGGRYGGSDGSPWAPVFLFGALVWGLHRWRVNSAKAR